MRTTPGFPLLLCLLALLAESKPVSGQEPVASRPAASQPRRSTFQPGVIIDWSAPAVLISSRVVLREGPLEFAACFAGKEHESILRIDADANHVFMALGLIGLTHGHPPRWDDASQRYEPPAGDLVDVRVVPGVAPDQAQVPEAVELWGWIVDEQTKRTPAARPWVFAGSRRLPERPAIVSSISGEGIAVVDTPGSLLSLSRSHTSEDISLWCAANTREIPPMKTAVTIVLTPARARRYEIRLSAAAEWLVDGKKTSLPDAADLISLSHRMTPASPQPIQVDEGIDAALCSSAIADLKRLTPEGSWELATGPSSAPAGR